jgi:hypothetical protein
MLKNVLGRVQSDVFEVGYTCYIILVCGRGDAVVKFTSRIEKLSRRWPICPWLIEGKWGVNSSKLRRCEIANLVGWPQPWLRNSEPRTVFRSHVTYARIIWCRRPKQSCRLQLDVQLYCEMDNGRLSCPSLHTLANANQSISLRGGQTLKRIVQTTRYSCDN